MDADTLAFFQRKVSEYPIVQCNELSQQLLGRVQFDRQSPFGEINLYMLRARVQACLPVIAFNASFGYIRLNADAEMTACFNVAASHSARQP